MIEADNKMASTNGTTATPAPVTLPTPTTLTVPSETKTKISETETATTTTANAATTTTTTATPSSQPQDGHHMVSKLPIKYSRPGPSAFRQLLPIAVCLITFATVFSILIVYMDTTGKRIMSLYFYFVIF